MTEMIICGLSMEMEIAKECDGIGNCNWCIYFEKLRNGALKCTNHNEILDKEKTNCKDWIVDHR